MEGIQKSEKVNLMRGNKNRQEALSFPDRVRDMPPLFREKVVENGCL